MGGNVRNKGASGTGDTLQKCGIGKYARGLHDDSDTAGLYGLLDCDGDLLRKAFLDL